MTDTKQIEKTPIEKQIDRVMYLVHEMRPDGDIEAELHELVAGVRLEREAKDPVVEKNREMLLQRSNVGVKKYGTTLHQNGGDLAYWLTHALEEGLDFVNYLQRAKQQLEDTTVEGTAAEWREKALYWSKKAHDMRQQALRGEPVDGIVQPQPEAIPGWRLHIHPTYAPQGEVCNSTITAADKRDGWTEFEMCVKVK